MEQLSAFELLGLPAEGQLRCCSCGRYCPTGQITHHEHTDWYATSMQPWCAGCRELLMSKQKPVGCILNCDSPSYPPTTAEYQQCAARGCKYCIADLRKRKD